MNDFPNKNSLKQSKLGIGRLVLREIKNITRYL